MSVSDPRVQLQRLRRLSAHLGSDPLLAQASSGNTSIKLDGVMWIKASGKWLIQAEDEDFLVPIALADIRHSLRENQDPAELSVGTRQNRRASVETAMHAVLPQAVVVHVHSVNAIAWSVRADGPARLEQLLAGLRWRWIPYTPSGVALARQIERALGEAPGTDVLILGNHGLVVGGTDCQAAEDLLAELERRLHIDPRPAPEPEFSGLSGVLEEGDWSLPVSAGVHALATDHIARRILAGGVLYPCQAIFLPDSVPPLPVGGGNGRHHHRRELFRIVESQGVALNKSMTRAERELLTGLAQVVQRIDGAAPVRYLTAGEIEGVLSEEAEKYRQATEAAISF